LINYGKCAYWSNDVIFACLLPRSPGLFQGWIKPTEYVANVDKKTEGKKKKPKNKSTNWKQQGRHQKKIKKTE
jgi:hypothetical protein